MKEFAAGCQRPAGQAKPAVEPGLAAEMEKGDKKNYAASRKTSPPSIYCPPAYHQGKFGEISLENYHGKWVMLCFYPGDFTFV